MIDINPISDASIASAVRRLRAGDLVAFPTETVYGLAANAFSALDFLESKNCVCNLA